MGQMAGQTPGERLAEMRAALTVKPAAPPAPSPRLGAAILLSAVASAVFSCVVTWMILAPAAPKAEAPPRFEAADQGTISAWGEKMILIRDRETGKEILCVRGGTGVALVVVRDPADGPKADGPKAEGP